MTENKMPKIPLKNGSEYKIPETLLSEFKQTYPAVDIISEMWKMRAWSLSNPLKRKTQRGVKAFMNSWLNSANNDLKISTKRHTLDHEYDVDAVEKHLFGDWE